MVVLNGIDGGLLQNLWRASAVTSPLVATSVKRDFH